MKMQSTTPRAIALWGYGRYGKKLYRAIRDRWSEEYRVTAVYDASFENPGDCDDLKAEGLTVEDPAHIEDSYHAGLFDAVLVSVINKPVYLEIVSLLEQLGIPMVTLIPFDAFKDSEDFRSCVPPEFDNDFHGHELRVFENIYATPSLMDGVTRPLLYLYDENGSIVRDNWYNYDIETYPELVLNVPMPLHRPADNVVRLEGDYCFINRMWGKNFWHFTYQEFEQVWQMEQAGFKGFYVVPKSSFVVDLFNLTDIDVSRILWVDDLNEGTAYLVERAYVLAADSYDPWKTAPAMLGIAEAIEKNIESDAELAERDYAPYVYVKRIGARKLVGLDELIASMGFETMIPEELSVKEQMAVYHNARVVIAPHGANVTDSLFMRPGAVLIEAFSAGWIRPCTHESLFLKGIHYLPIVDMPVDSNRREDQWSDFTINPRMVAATIRSAIALAGCSE